MAGFRFNLPDAKPGLFQDTFSRINHRMAQAMQLSVAELSENIRLKVGQNISSAGRFSGRWIKAFTVDQFPKGVASDRYVLSLFFDKSIPYAHIFEFGGTITPKAGLFNRSGLLWIPLTFGNVPKGMTAQEFGASRGGLFRVNRKGGKSPLLLDIKDRRPRFFGVPSVTLRQRFHIRDIGRRETAKFEAIFARNVAVLAAR